MRTSLPVFDGDVLGLAVLFLPNETTMLLHPQSLAAVSVFASFAQTALMWPLTLA